MRNFYIEYKNNEILQSMVAEFSWTKNVLIHQIDNKSYEKFLLNQTNFDDTISEKYKSQAKLALKDEYVFDFLELSKDYSKRQLEELLIYNIRGFLEEMGGNFAFIGNNYHLNVVVMISI